MGIWDKENCTFNNPNELHNEEAKEGISEGTGLTELYFYQEPKAALNNKMVNIDGYSAEVLVPFSNISTNT